MKALSSCAKASSAPPRTSLATRPPPCVARRVSWKTSPIRSTARSPRRRAANRPIRPTARNPPSQRPGEHRTAGPRHRTPGQASRARGTTGRRASRVVNRPSKDSRVSRVVNRPSKNSRVSRAVNRPSKDSRVSRAGQGEQQGQQGGQGQQGQQGGKASKGSRPAGAAPRRQPVSTWSAATAGRRQRVRDGGGPQAAGLDRMLEGLTTGTRRTDHG